MRVLVTGGTGLVGRATVDRLMRQRYTVRVIGRRADVYVGCSEYVRCDVADYEGVRQAVRGCDAVVHLAGVAHPALDAASEVFRVNSVGTYNVFEAAAQEGIRRIVTASSINVVGFGFGVKPAPVRYFPIDEDHPGMTSDPYSFSKQVLEAIGDYYWRRDSIVSVALRLPAVYGASQRRSEAFARRWKAARDCVASVLNLPDAARRERARGLVQAYDSLRQQRAFERPDGLQRLWSLDAGFAHGYGFFWSVIDARDAARAVEKSLVADLDGSNPLYVNSDDNLLGLDSRRLAETFFPEVSAWKKELRGSETLVSNRRAHELIGFRPRYSM